jgi:aminobenzoyl-glutamate utilization protein B
LDGPSQQRAPSNDCGDVSWKVPMGRVGFPSNIPGVPFHHWTGGAALATSIAHKGAVVGSKVLAGTATDLLSNPDLIRRAKETFALEIGDVVYQPLIPSDQSPPVNLNREIMEMFRPSMREHYLKKRPKFN